MTLQNQSVFNKPRHGVQSDGLHMTGCSDIFMLLFFSKDDWWLLCFHANICTSVTASRHPSHRGLAVTIQVQRGSPSVSPDASVPLVTVKAHSVTLPSNVFKAKHKPFHTDTCQKSTLYIQTCLRRGSSEYSRFNTHNVNTAFPLTLKTPFHVSAAAANVIWCMITSVLKYKCQKLWILYWCNLHGEHDLCLWLLCFLPVVEKIHPLSLHRRLEMLDDTKNAFACFQREILNFHGWDVNLHTALQFTLLYLNWITWYLKCMCWACNTYCITHL